VAGNDSQTIITDWQGLIWNVRRFVSVDRYGQLKLMPFWDPLRGDPRFEKIVASLAPK
jgi:hypothetical protein